MPDQAIAPLTDHETAEAIRNGALPSPQKYGDFWLFDLRITGTGAAYREALGEYAVRDADMWLSNDFVQRCNGLAVIFEHPEGAGLNAEEFRERAIGSIVLPYVKGDEVWGIAKIFDTDAAALMQTTHKSTSPGVKTTKGATPVELEDGTKVLDEGLPLVLDHLAICEAGVWDKNGPPEGIRLDSLIEKGEAVADKSEEEKAAEEKERDDMKARLDAAEAENAEMKKEREDRARKDAEESEAKAAEEEKADKKRKDARKKKHDSAKHDGEFMDCSRCDSEESEEEKEEKEEERGDKKSKKDAAKEAEVEAGKGTEIRGGELHDSRISSLEAEIARLRRANEPLTLSDRDELAKAYNLYDRHFQMLADATPQPLPGEKPIAYRKRAANALRPYTKSFQNYTFHDSQQTTDFGLVEKAILDEAMAYAKNPPAEKAAGRLVEYKDSTTLPGKIMTRFTGDHRAAWLPFMPATQRFVRKVNTQLHNTAHR